MEEDDGAPSGRSSPPTPKKVKLESEEPKELLKAEDHSEDESEEIEEQDEDEEEDGDGSPQLPLLLDMIDLPPSSTLPPTPPLPSSPRDLNMEQQDSDDEGPPPGWDNTYQLKERVEHMLTPVAISAILSDIKMEDVQQDGWNVEGAAAPELVASDMKVEEQGSDSEEDEGPPPGWDSKCHPESELQLACPTMTQSDIKTEDLQNGDGAALELVPFPSVICEKSDIKMEEQDLEEDDEGPPPGWDAKCQTEAQLQTPCPTPTITQSDIMHKTEEAQQDADADAPQPQLLPSDMKVEEQESEDEGPPPGWGWDSKCQTDIIKTEEIHQDAQNRDGPQPHPHPSPAPEVAPSAIKKVEEEDEERGPPPGWDSKSHPTTPPSESKTEDDQQQEDEGQGQGQGPPPQQQSNLASPIPTPSGARMECEEKPKNVEDVDVVVVVELERPQPQPPSRQQSVPVPVPPMKPVLKPPLATTNNPIPEMGQMVCGSCRRLLSYPKGARYVECGCCLEENYVLQEHEVGQVICGGCDVLLMYPYGAPKVRCVNCSTETEIGDQNRRPPLSEQQRRARRHLKRVQTGFNC